MMTLILQRGVSLKSFNAFGVEAKADYFARVHGAEDLCRLQDDAQVRGVPWLVLGAGSNVLFSGDFHGVVVQIGVPGIVDVGGDDLANFLRVGAGESWPALVEHLTLGGRGGIENLALIPGSAGAAPIQNVGAYGLEIAERLESVTVWESASGQAREMGTAECALGYRSSAFKRDPGGSRIVLHITLRLPRRWEPVIGYAELARELGARDCAAPGPREIFDAVCALRRRKLPDPAQIGNAGSFFKNPVIGRGQHEELIGRHPSVVSYPLGGGRFKLAAAWLIEASGFKGATRGRAGVYERQALVIVNRGGASGREILDLAREVQEGVFARFGVTLEPEAVIV